MSIEISSEPEQPVQSKIAGGYESLRAGKGIDGEAVFERIERELAAIEQSPA
jgi:hypothetical protein